jgi:hypothetical protein
MEPLTEGALAAAERQWTERGAESYRLVVQVRAPKFRPTLYEVVVARGQLVAIERDGEALRPEDFAHFDYSVSGLFDLLREDLPLAVMPAGENLPPIDLRARFEPDTGRLVRYRRTVGSARRRVLLVEVLAYEPREGELADAGGACAVPAVEP